MKAKSWLTVVLSVGASTLLAGCANSPIEAPKMVGMWAERFEGDKSLEVWARLGENGQQQAIVLFIEPKADGSGTFEAICGAGGYQDITLQDGAFDYEQDRLNAHVQRIGNNEVEVTVRSGCIPEEVYRLKPINENNSEMTPQDTLTIEKG